MKKIKNNVNDILLKIINNVKGDVIFCGSISDYFNFLEHDIDISNNISDIDIYAHDNTIITELEDIFQCDAILLDLPCEEAITMTRKFTAEHYYMPMDNTHIDIFLINKDNYNSIQKNENIFNGKKINIVDTFERNVQLNSTINFWYKTAPMTKRLLKYLKKRMIYNKIINDET